MGSRALLLPEHGERDAGPHHFFQPPSQAMGTSPFRDVQAKQNVVSIHLGIPTAEALQYCAVVGSMGYCIVIPSSTLQTAQRPLSSPANHSTSML